MSTPPPFWERLVGGILDLRVVVWALAVLLLAVGVMVSPFELPGSGLLPRDPVPVDAIPDVGENQQIVFTEWTGRSPRDVEDQVTYPLTTALLGIPGVKTIRTSSALGFSTLYVIFEADVEFYWSRSRVLEKLASLPPGTLPDGVSPTLGPDATALGQVFWYTLEGQDPSGRTVGGWDPDELRTIQDFTVRYALQAVAGVSEVSSVGGFVREYQVDVDPDAMRAAGVTLTQVADAVRRSNLDVGARTLEINGVEYLVRGVGFVEDLVDLEQTVVVARDHTPVRVSDVARVTLGPALRRGALDDEGAPAVGGVVVARYRENPKAVIEAVKARIATLQPGLPRRTLDDGTVSQVTVVPFYDRTELIDETLGTLSTALFQQLLVTLLVVLVMLRDLRSSALVGGLLPVGVLATFAVMKLGGVTADIMALGGIAIAIGTMVDIGIVFVENIAQQRAATPDDPVGAIRRGVAEVAPAVVTSVLTTLVSFLPVFGLTEAELRLFAPLAVTKTTAMAVVLVLAIVLLPAIAVLVLRRTGASEPARSARLWPVLAVAVAVWLVADWMPLGADRGFLVNLVFAGGLIGGILGGFRAFERVYPALLEQVLAHRSTFALLPLGLVAFGLVAWLGLDRPLSALPPSVRDTAPVSALRSTFPGLGRDYLPPFDEGAFLYMPTSMPHASVGEVLGMMSELDAAIVQIPEVDRVVGKLGRADSALDPAPVSMIETLITYHPEYGENEAGERVRLWRDHIRSPDDIWTEITAAAQVPGLTGAPLLMPIQARIVMLQSGMRAPMGVQVQGPSLEAIERFGLALEQVLRGVPQLRADTVFADRVVGKPYLDITLDREALGRFGLTVADVQKVLTVALGGATLTRTIEGRERYPVRVRYMREDRDSIEALERVFVTGSSGEPVPLTQVADIEYVRGPQVIRGENTFPTSYVLFDKAGSVSEVDAVAAARDHIRHALEQGTLTLPDGVTWEFVGAYQNQLRSEARMRVLFPVAVLLVFVLLYLQFRRVHTTLVVGSGVAVAVSGAFTLLWLYDQSWFLALPLVGDGLRALFAVQTTHLSVAVWVGVLALVGVATDDGVVMATRLKQEFERQTPATVEAVRAATVVAGSRRIRACLMTTATTVLALLPVVTSTGRGADLMVPMALPLVGGMAVELVTLFVVPVMWSAAAERSLARGRGGA